MVYVPQRALELLRLGSGNSQAGFRKCQEAAVRHIVEGRSRLFANVFVQTTLYPAPPESETPQIDWVAEPALIPAEILFATVCDLLKPLLKTLEKRLILPLRFRYPLPKRKSGCNAWSVKACWNSTRNQTVTLLNPV